MKFKGIYRKDQFKQQIIGWRKLDENENILKKCIKLIVALCIIIIFMELLYKITLGFSIFKVLMDYILGTVIITPVMLILCPLHEYLHSVFFPNRKDAEMYLFKGGAFITTDEPMSRNRFLICLLLPNIVLSIIPLILIIILIKMDLDTFPIMFLLIACWELITGVDDVSKAIEIFFKLPSKSLLRLNGTNVLVKIL